MSQAIAIHAPTPLRTPETTRFNATVASRCAQHIAECFQRYRKQCRQLTRQAAIHFQQCDWSAAQMDAAESSGLFDQFAQVAADGVGTDASRRLWSAVSLQYDALLPGEHDQIAARLFFARTQALCLQDMRLPAPTEATIFLPLGAQHAELHYSPCDQPLAAALMPMLSGMTMEAEWQNLASSAAQIAASLQSTLRTQAWDAQDIELLATVFYRGTRAYLIGCVQHQQGQLPLIIALRNDGEGACVDEVFLGTHAAALFRTGQRVLQADCSNLSATLGYVQTLFPEMSFAQLAHSVGWTTGSTSTQRN